MSAGDGRATPTAGGKGQEYEALATILQEPDGEPELCVGGVAESLPPQCGGPTVVGLDWETVPWRETANGVVWAEVTAVGTYDGERFTLTRPIRRSEWREPDESSRLEIECETPDGGWRIRDESKIDVEYEERAGAVARESEDFAGMWWRYTARPDGENRHPEAAVLYVAFTGRLDEHRAALEEVWGGALCVVERKRTYRGLEAIVERISRDVNDLRANNIDLLSWGANQVDNVVDIGVILADDATVAELRRRYGEEVVVTGSLRPLG